MDSVRFANGDAIGAFFETELARGMFHLDGVNANACIPVPITLKFFYPVLPDGRNA